ncbi:MAG: 50S ribosomal protein L23 [Methanomicrobia archaeon]|nr:50S ribosomal protein L23 [Methanomicrobia archaeon]RLF95812.1 MAG: 50S ribosomal protein L23 [Thermococci archaeon]RLF97009.1 MAG: 50S ribosomal protein L23 [Thermococci archaeon]RLF99323.1 MAG: 50S ribosomal protein L23 [Thermococci archaeon]HDN81787.1 50S ribosomal protein L23 [Methanomicrobia archaeon]
MDPYDILVHPLITEKNVTMMESENRLAFIVRRNAKKIEIKKSVEELYEVEVAKVSTMILPDGRKKAYVKLKEEYLADEVATKIGVF